MTLTGIVTVVLFVSLFGLVFALGLRARLEDVTYLFRHPALLVRSILAMNVVLLAVVVLVGQLFDLDPAIKIALVTLAVSPVPPLIPGKQIAAGGTAHYAVGLLVASALVSIFLVPISIEAIEYIYPFELHIAPSRVLAVVVVSIWAPLALGVTVARLFPDFGARIAPRLSSAAGLLLLAALIPMLIKGWSDLSELFGNGVVLCLVLFTGIGLVIGHLLGGPGSGDRAVLALASGTRHPGVAMAIASLNFPDQTAATALIVYHLVIGGVVSGFYVRWVRRANRGATTA